MQEETGYDITTLMSKTYIQRTMNNKLIRLYLVPGVPEDTKFQAMTRNEISVRERENSLLIVEIGEQGDNNDGIGHTMVQVGRVTRIEPKC